jgi:hypothetical protein
MGLPVSPQDGHASPRQSSASQCLPAIIITIHPTRRWQLAQRMAKAIQRWARPAAANIPMASEIVSSSAALPIAANRLKSSANVTIISAANT